MTYTYTSIDGQRVQTDVASAFNALNAAFRSAFGLTLHVRSGTRTFNEQHAIFMSRFRAQASGGGPYNDVRWYNGVRYVRFSAAGTVAVPGTSNHEEGGPIGPRALDIYDSGSSAGVTTAGTARANWIRNNSSRYGFKAAGYNFGEPWHIEYTGNFGGGSTAGGSNGSLWPAYTLYGEAWVKAIQEKLNRLGYGLEVDGRDGPATQAAVVNFQGKNGLTADGVAGPATNAKLDAVLAGSGSGGIAVDGQWGEATTRKLQAALGVAVDGQLGPQTIKALQAALGVTQDGVLGPESIKALQKFLNVGTDGSLGPQTVSALQTYLNSGGKFQNSTPPVSDALVVDGQWGATTTKKLQINLGVVPVDGVLGPDTIKKLQAALGQAADGVMGPRTVKALQTNVGATVDGALGPDTIKKLQEFLNANKIFTPVAVADPTPPVSFPKPDAPTYPSSKTWYHSSNCTARDGRKITHFYIHHAADPRPADTQIQRFLTANDRGVSPTWFVETNGNVHEIVPPDNWAPWTTPGNNLYSVSVETQNTTGDPTWGVSEESHVAIAKIVAWAHKRWGIPLDRDHVKGHKEAPGVPATACPLHLDVDKILAYAIQYATQIPEQPTPEPIPDPTPTPDPESWEITMDKDDAIEAGKFLDELRKLFP